MLDNLNYIKSRILPHYLEVHFQNEITINLIGEEVKSKKIEFK